MSDLINIDALADAIFQKLQPQFLQAVKSITADLRKDSGGDTDDLMTIGEAAKFLSLSPSTIYNNPDVPRMKKGKRLYFSKAELTAWLKLGKILNSDEINNEVDSTIRKKSKA